MRALAARCPSARAHKRGNPQIKEDYDHNGGGYEFAVIGPLRPAHARLPNGRREDDHRQQEEDTCHLEPHDAANTPEGTQKPAYAFGDSAAGLARRASRIAHNCAAASGRNVGASRRSGQMLPRHTPGNTHAYAKHSADGLRLHPVYDVNSDLDSRVLAASDCIQRASEVR